MEGSEDKLTAIRRQLDAIDDKLLDLLAERARKMAEVQAAKGGSGGVLCRPGREMQILRRLTKRIAGPLPADLVVRIWRDVVTSFTRLQGPFAIGALNEPAWLADLAQRHFGLGDPVRGVDGASRLFSMLADGAVRIAVFPSPEDSDTPCWTRIGRDGTQVIARLPVDGTETQPGGLVVGKQAFDPSGDDRHLLIIEFDEAVSRPRIAKRFADAGIALERILAETSDKTGQCVLAVCAAAIAANDPRLAALAGKDARVRLAGGYALPLALASAAGNTPRARNKGIRR
ncbi:MAG: chorismate mutase [Alphaproteobacteria bacterium]|nr:chorismate mutase [Alphaproteobacteria bacterium]